MQAMREETPETWESLKRRVAEAVIIGRAYWTESFVTFQTYISPDDPNGMAFAKDCQALINKIDGDDAEFTLMGFGTISQSNVAWATFDVEVL